jgi:hypothetical protein
MIRLKSLKNEISNLKLKIMKICPVVILFYLKICSLIKKKETFNFHKTILDILDDEGVVVVNDILFYNYLLEYLSKKGLILAKNKKLCLFVLK